jgi:hypothetical protein
MILQSRIGSSWSTTLIDGWTYDSNFVEGPDKTGTLISGVTAGSNVVLSLTSGEENNFTVGKYYYIYDFNGHVWVNYCKCTNVNTSAHTITVDTLGWNFPTGTVIAAYTHRYYASGNTAPAGTSRFSYLLGSTLPYVSSESITSNIYYCVNQQEASDYIQLFCGIDQNTLFQVAPDDLGYYTCQKPFLVERYNGYSLSSATDMNRGYGVAKNMYITNVGTMVAAQDGRTVGGVNWLYFVLASVLFYSSGLTNYGVMFCDTASAS